MNILGLNAYHGDASAALLTGGELAVAIEEERLNRIKHWAGLPVMAAKTCLRYGDVRELQHVAISRDPHAHVWRKLVRAVSHPRSWGRAASRARNAVRATCIGHALEEAEIIRPGQVSIHHVEHHRAHLASAFFASPFDEAAVVSVDGFGDYTSVMWAVGRGTRLEVHGSVPFPHSLGLFYTAFTQFLGFPQYGDEY